MTKKEKICDEIFKALTKKCKCWENLTVTKAHTTCIKIYNDTNKFYSVYVTTISDILEAFNTVYSEYFDCTICIEKDNNRLVLEIYCC